MRLPWVKVYAETWDYAPRLALLFGGSVGDAFLLVVTLYRWGQSLGPDEGDPTGLCESPRAVRLMAAALGVPMRRRAELAEHLADMGLIEVLPSGAVRVRGVASLYAGITERAAKRSASGKKAANARWHRQGGAEVAFLRSIDDA